MLPAIGTLTMSQYSLEDRCGTWGPTTPTGIKHKTAIGNSPALDASHDTEAMPEVRHEATMHEVTVATVADLAKTGPEAAHEEDR